MKVLYISTEDAKYGAPRSMKRLMEILKEKYGVECILLTNKKNSLALWCDEHGIENHQIVYRDIMAGDSYESHILNGLKHLLKYIRYVSRGISQRKYDKIGVNFNEIDIIHSNINRVDLGALIGRKYRIPHVWHLREMDEGVKNMHYYMNDWADYMNNNADCFIAITDAVKQSWINHGLDANKIRVIYNGINEEEIVPKKEPILTDKKIRIIMVGRVEIAKGQHELVEAICKLPKEVQENFEVDFIGESYSDYRSKIKKIIEKNKCATPIRFCGYSSSIGEILDKYDIGVTCSAAEAFGRTTVEYMMANLLVIASSTGANKELIQNGVNGIVYEYHDVDMLKNILLDVFSNKEKYRSIAQNGRVYAVSRFNSEKNADEIYNIYTGLLSK